jgi:hypothetical protein
MAKVASDASNQKNNGAGAAYYDLVKEQLEEERARKESLERRGSTVITASAFLVSLLFGLAAWATTENKVAFEGALLFSFVVSIACFLLAAIAGMLANWLMNYEEPSISQLRKIAQDKYWTAESATGEQRVSDLRVDVLETPLKKNDQKGRFLRFGLGLEVVAAFAVAFSIWLLLTGN